MNAAKFSKANNDASAKSIEDGVEDHMVEVSNIGVQVSKKSLWKNWGLMASITVISLWVLHATSYSEVRTFG